VRLILDTHILVWWLHDDPAKLSRSQRHALSELEQGSEPAALSAISLWELAKLRERGRLGTTKPLDDLLQEVESHPLVNVVALSCPIAAESVRLGDDFHRDPADQIIVATARCHDLTLVTADDRIRKWGKVRVL
jgi:PIN domain nuclease of toxin-antitoxin system